MWFIVVKHVAVARIVTALAAGLMNHKRSWRCKLRPLGVQTLKAANERGEAPSRIELDLKPFTHGVSWLLIFADCDRTQARRTRRAKTGTDSESDT